MRCQKRPRRAAAAALREAAQQWARTHGPAPLGHPSQQQRQLYRQRPPSAQRQRPRTRHNVHRSTAAMAEEGGGLLANPLVEVA
eukprot:COSAG04_NODE_19311_length_419_cov_0.784375_2_plen_83_part_01